MKSTSEPGCRESNPTAPGPGYFETLRAWRFCKRTKELRALAAHISDRFFHDVREMASQTSGTGGKTQSKTLRQPRTDHFGTGQGDAAVATELQTLFLKTPVNWST